MDIPEPFLERAKELRKFFEDKELLKKHDDITYSLSKIDYHLENFDKVFNEGIEQIKKEILNSMMEEIKHIKFLEDGTKAYKLTTNHLKIRLNKICFIYEYDCIIQEIKRCVDFAISLLCELIDENFRDLKSVENFFKGLKNEVSTPTRCCLIILEKHEKLKNYLIDQWDSWFERVNASRTNTVHKSIINKVESSNFEVKWNVLAKKKIHSEIILSELTVEGIPIKQYLGGLHTQIKQFVGHIMRHIYVSYLI